jgi:gas vesicle structural protein
MAVERTSGGSSLIDVLDRVLDKGIVIDAWVRVSLVGIDLITVEARVVVASIDTYIKYSEAVGQTSPVSPVSRPVAAAESKSTEALLAENAELRAQLQTESGNGETTYRPRKRGGRGAAGRN